jgi:hypothetical protein
VNVRLRIAEGDEEKLPVGAELDSPWALRQVDRSKNLE